MRYARTMSPRIAVVIPCYNEAVAIGAVVAAFRTALPMAAIHVYDNNSQDETGAIASAAGAVVQREMRQGKGHVVRRAFADVDADVYVLVDGDGTYDAAAAPAMVDLLLRDQLDMVNGARQDQAAAAYRPGTPRSRLSIWQSAHGGLAFVSPRGPCRAPETTFPGSQVRSAPCRSRTNRVL